jgi:hypothetical protein
MVFITALIIWAINTISEYDARVVANTTTAKRGTSLGSGVAGIERLNPLKNHLFLYTLIRDLNHVPTLESDPPSHFALCIPP